MRSLSGALLIAVIAWHCYLVNAAPSQSFSRTARRHFKGWLRCCSKDDVSRAVAFSNTTCKCEPNNVSKAKTDTAHNQQLYPNVEESQDDITKTILQKPVKEDHASPRKGRLVDIGEHHEKASARKPPLPALHIDPPPQFSLPRADSTKYTSPFALNAKVYHTQLSSSSLDSEPYSSRFNSGHTSPSGPLSRASSYRLGYKNGVGEGQSADNPITPSLSRAPSHSHQRYRVVSTQQEGHEVPLHHYEHIWLEHAKYLFYRELPLSQ